jgi:hypothetical protein
VHFSNNQLYDRVIGITQEYLGPVSKRCIDRQITNHLHKQPEEIDENDLKLLVSWVEALTALLTGDKQVSKELTRRLELLTHKQRAGL